MAELSYKESMQYRMQPTHDTGSSAFVDPGLLIVAAECQFDATVQQVIFSVRNPYVA